MKYSTFLSWVLALVPVVALAGEEKPLWELGLGAAALSFPAYRGSDKVHSFLMPVPYFTYHGDFLKADQHGIRGSLFNSDRVDLTISLSASPPTKSSDVAVRANMPDLKSTVEFGPEIDFTLWRGNDRLRSLRLRLPVREAYTIEHSPKSVGVVFSPNLNADFTNLPGLSGWNVGLVAGPIYATKKQHDYFYGVAPEYATLSRPVFNATGGYGGSQFLVSLSKRFSKTWVGAFVRYDSLRGAVFKDSPLVMRDSFFAAGVAVSWILGESKTHVMVND